MADEWPAKLLLIHVIQFPIYDPYTEGYFAKGIEQDLRRDAEQMLRKRRAQVPAHLNCQTEIHDGDTAVGIAGAARRWGADFIVIGTHTGVGDSPDFSWAALPRQSSAWRRALSSQSAPIREKRSVARMMRKRPTTSCRSEKQM